MTITHPFHPLSGKRFSLISRWKNWGGDRVLFEDDEGRVRSLPTGWTSLGEVDPYVTISAGRSLFRVDDLIALAALVKGLSPPRGCKGDSAGIVMENTP